jgi:hypothetical protein
VRGLSRIGELEVAATIVADSGLAQDARVAIGEHGVELVLASLSARAQATGDRD